MAPPVAGYVAWYDAQAITGSADGATLSSWPDGSGNGHNLGVGAGAPVYHTSLIGGHPAVAFNGASFMSSAFTPPAQPFTIIGVIQASLAAVQAATMEWVNAGGTSTGAVLGTVPSAQWHMYAGTTLNVATGADGAMHVVAGVFNGASSKIVVDDVTVGSGSAGTNNGVSPFILAAFASGVQYFTGSIGEVIVYPSALSAANLTSLYNYLNARWSTPTAVTGTATVALGPLTVATLGADTDAGAAAMTIGPLTTAVASSAVTVGGCGRGAWLTLGGLAVNLDDERAGYFCTQLDLGWPAVREVVSNAPDQNGVVDRTQFMGSRVVSANITAIAGAGARLDEVAAMFAPFMAPSARPVLHYALDRPGVSERTLTVRGSGYSWPVAGPYQRDIQLQWVAADPVARDPTVRTVTVAPGATATITTPGDVAARPRFRITGPVTGPAVTLTPSDGPAWQLAFLGTFTVAAGHFVDVDTAARTVYYDADPAQPRLSSIDWTRSSWQWIPPAPSSTTITLTGTATSGATQAAATWQDGYLT